MKKRLLVVSAVFVIALGGLAAAFYRADVPAEVLRADYADNVSRFVEVDGMEVHYKDEGTGDVLVLLHGFGSSLHTWDGWARELRPSLRIVRLDLPGHGLTGPNPENDYRTAAYADFLDRFADRIGLGRFALAGNSMGGAVSWLYAARHPERVEKLILVDAAGAPRAEAEPAGGSGRRGGSSVMRFVRMPVIGRLVARFTPRFLFEKALLEVFVDDALVTDELVDRHYRLALRAGNRGALLSRMSLPGEDLRHLIPSIGQPTLVMWGRGDTWIPVAHAERFHAALPASKLVVYDGVGHLPQEEVPARSAADVRAFLLGGHSDDSSEEDPNTD